MTDQKSFLWEEFGSDINGIKTPWLVPTYCLKSHKAVENICLAYKICLRERRLFWFCTSSCFHWIISLLIESQMEARGLAPDSFSEEHLLTLEVTEFR